MDEKNIARALEKAAAVQGEKVGLVALEGGRWEEHTFAGLTAQARGYAAALARAGVRQGERVMLMVRPSRDFVSLTFALFQLGAVVILIDPGMGYKNLLRCIGSVRPDYLIGIPKAIFFSRLFIEPFRTVRRRFCPQSACWGLARHLVPLAPDQAPPLFQASPDDPAAIIFTTGSTGPPKGVQYTHGIFHAQLELIRDYYGIGPGDVDQPGFPLFGLFSTALGAKAVIPDMDPTRPAQVDPARFVRTLFDHQVSYSFGSPAIWNVVSRWCLERQLVLPLHTVLMAGAPVSGELVARVARILPPRARVFTPYGATESLPVASIEGREISGETWALTRRGQGACVGRALPGMEIRIIATVTGEISDWRTVRQCGTGERGEIVVRGPVVTREYADNQAETRLAKIADAEENGFWHRMGDIGSLDEQGRLWFCGRKAHRVATEMGVMDTIPCEALFNEHPRVRRTALVGLCRCARQVPVLVVEPEGPVVDREQMIDELKRIGQADPLTAQIEHFLFHRSFPVDIRHNAKIFREQLALWAMKQLQLPCG